MDAQRKWKKALEEAADVLGEMLIESAEGKVEHSYEILAEAVLRAGLQVLLKAGTGKARIEAAANAMYRMLHVEEKEAWGSLPIMGKEFWEDIAENSVRASDQALLDAIENVEDSLEEFAPS